MRWQGEPELDVRAAIAVAGVAAQEMWGGITERMRLEAILGDWEPLVEACNGDRERAEALWLSQRTLVYRLFVREPLLERQVMEVAKELCLRGKLDELDILAAICGCLRRWPEGCER